MQREVDSIVRKDAEEGGGEEERDEMVNDDSSDEGDDEEVVGDESQSRLFSGFVFFLSREVREEVVRAVVESCGGRIERDERSDFITHHVVDRPSHPSVHFSQLLE